MMKLSILATASVLLATPAAAQLSQEAYTWGAEVTQGQQSTVIAARKKGNGWSIVMECSNRGRVTKTLRGYGGWMRPGLVLAVLDGGIKLTVVPHEDGSLGVLAHGSGCAEGNGMLTSGGG